MKSLVLAVAFVFVSMVSFVGCSSKVAAVDNNGNPIPEKLGGRYDTVRPTSLQQDVVRYNVMTK